MIRCRRLFGHKWSVWENSGRPGDQFAKQFQTCARCGLVRTKYMDHNFL